MVDCRRGHIHGGAGSNDLEIGLRDCIWFVIRAYIPLDGIVGIGDVVLDVARAGEGTTMVFEKPSLKSGKRKYWH